MQDGRSPGAGLCTLDLKRPVPGGFWDLIKCASLQINFQMKSLSLGKYRLFHRYLMNAPSNKNHTPYLKTVCPCIGRESPARSGLISTWMEDRLGIPGAVSFCFSFTGQLTHFSKLQHSCVLLYPLNLIAASFCLLLSL